MDGFDKNMRAGYQGKYDSMRAEADRLSRKTGVGNGGPDVIFSKSAADRTKMRPYREGGMVEHEDVDKKKKEDKDVYKKGGCVSKRLKFAGGGAIWKYRHEMMTKDGQPKSPKKSSLKDTVY
jgi:hypothetical protein